MKINDFIELMNKISPEEISMKWDNSGEQLIFRNKDIKKILIALDITENIINEALENNIDLILTHHPIFFNPIKRLDTNDFLGASIIKLVQNEISVYSAHTSFDIVKYGNNDYLCNLLGLNILSKYNTDEADSKKIGINNIEIGKIAIFESPKSLNEIVALVKAKLNISTKLNVVFGDEKLVTKVLVCTGSGGDMVKDAIANNCDLLITGDVSYHSALAAKESGLKLIDAGHYHTEKIFKENIYELLKKYIDPDVYIKVSNIEQNPFNML